MDDRKKSIRMACRFLSFFIDRHDNYGLFGDIEELWNRKSGCGLLKMNLWLICHLFRIIITAIMHKSIWSMVMFGNYIKTGLRTIKRQKSFAFINIFGLSIGLSCTILILLWIHYEFSFDTFHHNKDRICRVLINYQPKNIYQKFTHGSLGGALKDEYPQIVNATRLYPLFPLNKNPLRNGEEAIIASGSAADPSFFNIFTFPFLKGNPNTALKGPMTIVLTAATAKKLFDDEDPVGKIISFELWNKWHDVTVSGVIEDIPSHSHIQCGFFIPSGFIKRFRQTIDTWDDIYSPTYVLLEKNTPVEELERSLTGFIQKHRSESPFTIHLHPLKKIHLYRYEGGGPIIYITIFSSIGILILAIAIINFVNLSTARTMYRAKEVGVRKVIGSNRIQLVKQFLMESIILAVLASIFAVVIVLCILPHVNIILETNIVLSFSLWFLFAFVCVVLLTGISAGIYPALYLSRMQPVRTLKGSLTSEPGRGLFRKVMVTFQFVISIFLMICALITQEQIVFLKNRDLGFDKESILNLEMRGRFHRKYRTVKQELLKHPNILSVTAANTSFLDNEKTTSSAIWEGKQSHENVTFEVQPVDYDYLHTFGMKMVQGRFFSEEYATDATESIIVNESAVKAMGLDSPINKICRSAKIPSA